MFSYKGGMDVSGITGWIDYQKDLSGQMDVLNRMNNSLSNRGQDGEGYWVSKHALLGHRRLAVIDLVGGVQPMVKRVGEQKFIITYNGTLYNMHELRQKLLALGYSFQTNSDTEVILTAYAQWGEKCLDYLNGVFAFAIWDEKNQQLFAARDRIGVKPFFYSQVDTSFIFASEIKALLEHPSIEPIVDEEGLAEVLMIGPARTPGIGVFKQIKELKPGHFIRVDQEGVHLKCYWELVSKHHEDDFEITTERVRELFVDAVQKQLISDVPIGCMLSGGLDSSAIATCVAQIFKNEKRGVLPTFSIDYVGNEQHFQTNEFQPNADRPWIQYMSQYLGTKHHDIFLDNHELVRHLSSALIARDLPGMVDIDASLLLFSCEIKKEVSVVLSGEGADELFGGYPWFYREELIAADTFPWAKMVHERIPFISPEIIQKIKPLDYVEARYQEALAEVPRFSEESTREARMRELFYLNMTRWLPTLLDRQDRMSTACGLEVRNPFCDHRLIEYVWNIPSTMKFHGQREKGLLRYVFQGILPDPILKRKKSPYPKTHHPDYLRIMQQEIKRLLKDKEAPLFHLLDRKAVRQFVEQDLSQKHLPWFGQLMNVPALLGYWLQLNEWLLHYKVRIQ